MAVIALNIDGAERTCRAEILAGAATDTFLGVDYGYLQRLGIIGIPGYHGDCTCGAMTGAVATRVTVGFNNTIIFNPDGMAYADCGFLLTGDAMYRTGRTHFAATRTLGTAIASLV